MRNPLLSPDGRRELRIETFKDAEGRVKRQAARFQVWAYDDESPQGRPLKLGDPIEGGGNAGVLVDIQWRVYLANKKASWYEFGVPPVPWTIYGLGLKPCIAVVAGSVLDISSSRS